MSVSTEKFGDEVFVVGGRTFEDSMRAYRTHRKKRDPEFKQSVDAAVAKRQQAEQRNGNPGNYRRFNPNQSKTVKAITQYTDIGAAA